MTSFAHQFYCCLSTTNLFSISRVNFFSFTLCMILFYVRTISLLPVVYMSRHSSAYVGTVKGACLLITKLTSLRVPAHPASVTAACAVHLQVSMNGSVGTTQGASACNASMRSWQWALDGRQEWRSNLGSEDLHSCLNNATGQLHQSPRLCPLITVFRFNDWT